MEIYHAGFSASTCTNPIWLVKTRLQLDRATGSSELTVRQCVRNIFKSHVSTTCFRFNQVPVLFSSSDLCMLQGLTGFWKGVTASYWGISETIIHFVIYESLKKKVVERQERRRRRRDQQTKSSSASSQPEGERDLADFAGFMLCGACSKTCATIVAYPHGEIRGYNLNGFYCSMLV